LVKLSPLLKAGNKRASTLGIVAIVLLLVAAFVFLMLLAVNTFARLAVVPHWIAHLKGTERHKAASAPARIFDFLFRTNITLSTCTAILVIVQEFRHSTTSAVISSIGHAESPAMKALSYLGLLFLCVEAWNPTPLTEDSGPAQTKGVDRPELLGCGYADVEAWLGTVVPGFPLAHLPLSNV